MLLFIGHLASWCTTFGTLTLHANHAAPRHSTSENPKPRPAVHSPTPHHATTRHDTLRQATQCHTMLYHANLGQAKLETPPLQATPPSLTIRRKGPTLRNKSTSFHISRHDTPSYATPRYNKCYNAVPRHAALRQDAT